MNETTTTKKTEFVFRRLADSFDQFVGDLSSTLFGSTIGLVLLGLLLIAVMARVTYRYANPESRAPGVKDPTANALKISMWVSLLAFVAWWLIAYYTRDTDPARSTGESVSQIGSNNAIKWYSFVIALFTLGCVFVALMYVKDTKTVRWY